MAVTRLYPRPAAGELISQWDGREDFISSLLASCHIPFYLDGSSVATRFREGWYCDGGLTQVCTPAASVSFFVTCARLSSLLAFT